MPNISNIVEKTMRQLQRRLKTIENFIFVGSPRGYINLLISYLRIKPLTDCQSWGKYDYRFSHLELASAFLLTPEWLERISNALNY